MRTAKVCFCKKIQPQSAGLSLIHLFQKVFFVCFSVTDPATLESVESKWIPEVSQHFPEDPIIILGLKTDLRNDPAELQRLEEKGLTMVNEKSVMSCFLFMLLTVNFNVLGPGDDGRPKKKRR